MVLRIDPGTGLGTRKAAPKSHRDNLTGDEKLAALLEDLLIKQTEIWRWNVGPYVFKRALIQTTTPIASQAELSLARFTSPVGLGGSVFIGQFGISSAESTLIKITIDDQTIQVAGGDISGGDVTESYNPSVVLSIRDPIHTFANGAVAPLFNFVLNFGDIRGSYWRRAASLSVENTGLTAINLYKSEFTTKIFTE